MLKRQEGSPEITIPRITNKVRFAGIVKGINTSEKRGTVKEPVETAELIEAYGIAGDAHAGDWHRQISLLGIESTYKMKSNGISDIGPGSFAENITTEGITLYTLPVGTLLKIGDAELKITQIGKECHKDCDIKRLTGDCVMPREGVFAAVVRGGTIRLGDSIEIV